MDVLKNLKKVGGFIAGADHGVSALQALQVIRKSYCRSINHRTIAQQANPRQSKWRDTWHASQMVCYRRTARTPWQASVTCSCTTPRQETLLHTELLLDVSSRMPRCPAAKLASMVVWAVATLPCTIERHNGTCPHSECSSNPSGGRAQAQLALGNGSFPVLLTALREERGDTELVRGILECLVLALQPSERARPVGSPHSLSRPPLTLKQQHVPFRCVAAPNYIPCTCSGSQALLYITRICSCYARHPLSFCPNHPARCQEHVRHSLPC